MSLLISMRTLKLITDMRHIENLFLDEPTYRFLIKLLMHKVESADLSVHANRIEADMAFQLLRDFKGKPGTDIGEYRILESQGRFYIQQFIEIPQKQTFWQWIRKKPIQYCKEWRRVDIHGEGMYFAGYLPPQPMRSFSTLEKAKNRIKILTSLDRIHRV